MTFKNKKLIVFSILFVSVFSYEIYSAVPDQITVIDGKNNNIPYTVSKLKSGSNDLKLFGFIPYKTVEVNVIPDQKLILSGRTIGMKINVDGALVLGLADIKTPEGTKVCPALKAGITTGDLIKSINGQQIDCIDTLEEIVCKSDNLNIVYERNGKEYQAEITPALCAEDNLKKLGVWVRGGTTGIGTMTYISPSDGQFGALGHPITDADTGEIIKTENGDLFEAEILGVKKSERGLPGEIQGAIAPSTDLGDIKNNSQYGVFGVVSDIPMDNLVEIASKNEIGLGDAYILSDVAGNEPIMYSAEILHISNNSDSNKGLVIKVTDERLLSLTGGIVQGMSGSPIIQNGKLIGAVTHVLVNDPTRGYGIFIENMLSQAEKAK